MTSGGASFSSAGFPTGVSRWSQALVRNEFLSDKRPERGRHDRCITSPGKNAGAVSALRPAAGQRC